MRLTIFALLITVFVSACGTDVKPTYFTNMFRDEGDIDRLSECLAETPEDAGDTIIVTADKQCLIDLSKRDTADPNVDATFSEILQNPEAYLGKLVEFEAVFEKYLYGGDRIRLVTNEPDLIFEILGRGKEIYVLDADGEESPLQPYKRYKFRCRIYEIKKHVDLTGAWQISAEFIIFDDKEIASPPETVTE